MDRLESTHNLTLEQMDRDSVLHPSTVLAAHVKGEPRIVTRASGIAITDQHGRAFIDAVAGLWCVNIGYGRQSVIDAMARQGSELAYYHTFASASNEAQIRLAHRLLKMAPGRMSKVFFGNSGSDANDTNLKLVWYYQNQRGKPAKKKIISRKRAYHGTTLAAASLTGLPAFHALFDLPIPSILHVDTPDPYRGKPDGMSERDYSATLARSLDETIEREGPETVAAFIAEPVMGAGGVIVPPDGYFEAIQPVLKKHDVLLIADEVICGFGRLGRMFGSEVYGIEPDLVTIAKGLTSGYFPMSASFISEPIWQVLLDTSEKTGVFGHGFTYSGHPIGAAAALANLDIIEGEDLPGNAARVGAHLQRRLREEFTDHPLIGHVRGIGLIAGLEIVQNKATKASFPAAAKAGATAAAAVAEEGLIVRPLGGDTLAISPPLTLTIEDADQIVTRIARGLAKAERTLTA